ncbi:MAG TPA: MMPL family transporter [Mycobacteriales bacterium]|nr:MMPL family transporter [Mycobacteriales bacterium]
MPPARARRRWIVAGLLLLWLLILVVAGPFSGRLAEVSTNDNAAFLPATAESTEVNALQQRFVDQDTTPGILVWERQTGITDSDLTSIKADLAQVKAVPRVVSVSPPIPSKDGKAVQAIVQIAGTDGDELTDAATAVRLTVQQRSGLPAYVTGPAGLLADFIAAFGGIDSTLLLVTGVVVIVILLLVYRSPVLWFFPILSVGAAYSLAAGLVYWLADSDVLTLNGQSQGILTVLVFGAGTDYALLIISRFREELRRHESKYAAMAASLRGAGPAILASGATVILGLLCLLVSDLSSNKSLGPVSALGIAATMAAMLTLLPALLALVGRLAFWPFVPRYGSESTETSGIWGRVAGFVGRHGRPAAAVVSLVLIALAFGISELRVSGLAQSESFTTTQESVTGQQVLERHFPAGVGSPAVVIARSSAAQQVLSAVTGTPGVSSAAFLTSTPSTSGTPDPSAPPRVEGGLVEIEAVLAATPDSAEAEDTIERLRTAVHAVPSADAKVGGFTAINLDVSNSSTRDRTVIIPIVLLVIFLVLAVLLRALVAPLLLIVTVVLSFAATLGVCALVFNHIFGFAGADTSFPLFAFVFLVALGIDYNIFLMTRVREETLHLGTRPGVLRGLAVTGGVITSAGVVLAATFSVLGILPLVFLAELGFAVAFGVLLDTIVVRSILVPALVYDFGKVVWWPGALARRDEPSPPAPVEA